ncbi:MAG: DUF429 domain-containing protein [Armatimonadetes bacterium]|nr:DUF429 domain-containing protein [Anaerolineae bacterium]
MTITLGVDGCRAGWAAFTLDGDTTAFAVYPTIAALWMTVPEAAEVWIDIPIGLPDSVARACDAAARRLLGKRGSSVFAVPTRAALYAPDYTAACDLNQERTGKRFSRQTWNIAPKIREVDTLLRTDARARAAFHEAHPELVFYGLAGAPLLYPKKTPAGYAERLAILQALHPDAPTLIAATLQAYLRRDLARDDSIDALALALAARLPGRVTLPTPPDYDAHGLPMQLVCATG